jgi:hypothetical protein
MDKAQAAREARSLAGEWVDAFRHTDDSWKEVYTPVDLARVEAELDRLWKRLANAGPSLFHRLAAERRSRRT